MNEKVRNILLLLSVVIVLVIFVDLIFNFSGLTKEKFTVSSSYNSQTDSNLPTETSDENLNHTNIFSDHYANSIVWCPDNEARAGWSGGGSTIPYDLQTQENMDLKIFFDAGNIWGVDYSSSLDDSNSIRTSTGFALEIITPVGPLSFSYAEAISKASTDKTESFKFQLGTTF